jgi:hypothetical protein
LDLHNASEAVGITFCTGDQNDSAHSRRRLLARRLTKRPLFLCFFDEVLSGAGGIRHQDARSKMEGGPADYEDE